MAELRKISDAELRAHSTPSDAWIAISGDVYDVTRFLALHPGGETVLLPVLGRDATDEFNNFHSPSVLHKFRPKLRIGRLEDYEPFANKLSIDETAFGDLVPFGDPSWYQRFNSPYFNDSHVAWRARMRAFVDDHIVAKLHEMHEAELNAPPPELLLEAGRQGLLAAVCGPPWAAETMAAAGLETPPELGVNGERFDCFHELIAHDELARCGDMTLVSGLVTGISVALPPILQFGTNAMRAKVAPDVIAGRASIALCITEPQAGSDVAGLRCAAVRSGEHFIVNGNKKYITNGAFSQYFVTVVRTASEEEAGRGGGLSFVLLERGMPGFSVRKMKIGGLTSSMSGTAYLDFQDVRVPVENVIGEVDNGFRLIMHNFNHERFGIVCQCARLARCCLEEAIVHATRRETFGKKLHQHQAVRMKVAEMSRHIEALQAWLELVAYQMNTMAKEEAMTKLGDTLCLLKVQASRTFELCARQAVHIFGGYGLQSTGPGAKVEALSKQVHGLAIPGGAEDILDDFAARAAFKMASLVSKI